MSSKARRARRNAQFGKGPDTTGASVHPLVSHNTTPAGRLNTPPGMLQVPTNSTNRQSVETSPYNDLVRQWVRESIESLDVGGNWFSPFQPVQPFGPPNIKYPRTFDYATGINLDIRPTRLTMYGALRSMSRTWGLLRTVIETRKDQFMRMPHAFQVKGAPRKANKYTKQLDEFFRKPDGKHPFSKWKRLLLEDLLVIDAPTIYKWRSLDGTPLALDVVDGSTIKPLIDDAGRRPTDPDPAYQQIIKGLPMTNWTENDILYAPMRPTTDMPFYGYSPVEQIMVEITAGIKRLTYQVSFWSEGSMPELIVTVPDTWTPTQLAQYQGMFDSMMAGNVPYKSKVRFMPGGMKPFDIKNANGEALKADIDEWWARLICYAFGVSPQPFIRMMNRSTAQSAQQAAEEEGLHPLMLWFKEEIMDPIIQQDFGFDDVEFSFLPNPEVDQQKQMTVLTGYVKEGIMARNEARDQLGFDLKPGADDLTVDTPTGPFPIKELIEAHKKKLVGEPDRVQEAHDADVADTLASAKQKTRQPKVVGKTADAPFLEAIGRGRTDAGGRLDWAL